VSVMMYIIFVIGLRAYQLFHHCSPQSPSGGGGLMLRARSVVRL
jgi:hypothetical protein